MNIRTHKSFFYSPTDAQVNCLKTILKFTLKLSGPGNSVGIATNYGLGGPGIESWWGRDFPHLPRPVLGPIQPPVRWVPDLSRG
jgi:hypothetical protein